MERSAADDKITVLFYFTHCTNTQQHPLSPLSTFILVPQRSLSRVPCTATRCPSYSHRHCPARPPPPTAWTWPNPAWPGKVGTGGSGQVRMLPLCHCIPHLPRAGSAGAIWGWLMAQEPFTPDGMGTSDVTCGTRTFSRLLSQVGLSPGSVKVM